MKTKDIVSEVQDFLKSKNFWMLFASRDEINNYGWLNLVKNQHPLALSKLKTTYQNNLTQDKLKKAITWNELKEIHKSLYPIEFNGDIFDYDELYYSTILKVCYKIHKSKNEKETLSDIQEIQRITQSETCCCTIKDEVVKSEWTAKEKDLYIPKLLNDYNQKLNKLKDVEDIIEHIFLYTRYLLCIHPFMDGNGRLFKFFSQREMIKKDLDPIIEDTYNILNPKQMFLLYKQQYFQAILNKKNDPEINENIFKKILTDPYFIISQDVRSEFENIVDGYWKVGNKGEKNYSVVIKNHKLEIKDNFLEDEKELINSESDYKYALKLLFNNDMNRNSNLMLDNSQLIKHLSQKIKPYTLEIIKSCSKDSMVLGIISDLIDNKFPNLKKYINEGVNKCLRFFKFTFKCIDKDISLGFPYQLKYEGDLYTNNEPQVNSTFIDMINLFISKIGNDLLTKMGYVLSVLDPEKCAIPLEKLDKIFLQKITNFYKLNNVSINELFCIAKMQQENLNGLDLSDLHAYTGPQIENCILAGKILHFDLNE